MENEVDLVKKKELNQSLKTREKYAIFGEGQETILIECLLRLPVAMYLVDSDHKVLFSNENLSALIDYSLEEIIGTPITGFRAAPVMPGPHRDGADEPSRDRLSCAAQYRTRAGREISVQEHWIEVTAIDDISLYACAVFVRDGDRNGANDVDSSVDPLTHLPNRRLLLDRIDMAIRHATRHRAEVAVLFIDMDRFKDTNDTYGHRAGDQVLCEAAARIRHCIRDSDTLGRVGGDEFAVVLSESGPLADVARVADRMLGAFIRPIDLFDGQTVYAGCSIGIACWPKDGTDAETLLHHADMALYVAKRKGRNSRIFFDDSMRRAAQDRIKLEIHLRQAVANSAFEILYQPVYEHDAGISSIEALVRLRGPDGDLIEPARFLGVAEDIGLGPAIGRLVLNRACAQAVAWRSQGADTLSVSVNVSGRQIEADGFVDSIDKALKTSGLPASALTLEVHESIIMSDSSAVEDALRRVTAWGVTVAIDEFGAGYSSLKRMMELPLKVLKINRAFIQDMVLEGPGSTLVGLVADLADRMGLLVVAEGVETELQSSMLTGIACTRHQGFLYARPAAAEEVTRLLFQGQKPQ